MRFFPRWWDIRTDPLIKQAAIDGYSDQIAARKAMLTTPDYIDTILDSKGNSIPWNAATKQLIEDDIVAIEAKITALG